VLHDTFVPHLLANSLPLQTQWFMLDGARLHTANVVLDFPHDSSDSLIISNRWGQNCPPNSPDLNPYDCFLWESLKGKIFPKEPQTEMELRVLIRPAVR
jgi:hypothetical protein